eukprot:TRINITY_DN22233_c1_g2_i1.p1 TRINITY_DN22233_c1_g2~~TRINITY_DN22233_c1_g2_i1.p1  ORF type:complete len:202 (-),score=-8.24 TRINITY_DN22233_c1_g2_i1:264-869(-)
MVNNANNQLKKKKLLSLNSNNCILKSFLNSPSNKKQKQKEKKINQKVYFCQDYPKFETKQYSLPRKKQLETFAKLKKKRTKSINAKCTMHALAGLESTIILHKINQKKKHKQRINSTILKIQRKILLLNVLLLIHLIYNSFFFIKQVTCIAKYRKIKKLTVNQKLGESQQGRHLLLIISAFFKILLSKILGKNQALIFQRN